MCNQTANPWVERLPVFASDAELLERMYLPVAKINDLSSTPARSAARILDRHLDSVYVPTRQGLEFIRRVLESGFAHCLLAYETPFSFVQRMNNPTATWELEPETWMATGDAGIGKTAVINTLNRLLGVAPIFQATPDCPPLPIIGGVFLTLGPRSTFAEILSQLATEIGLSDFIDKVNARAKRALRNEIHKRGVFFILLDESQVAAVGRTAGAAYVRNLMLLRDFGVPLIYACNFSMTHGMLGQHAQNQQRLLVDPFLFRPFALNDPDFTAMVKAYILACDGILKIDLENDLNEIHRLTDGRGRPLRLLIVTAYHLERAKGSTHVVIGRAELQNAYCDQAYGALRSEIEELNRHRVERSGLRTDLMFPLELQSERSESARRAMRDALAAAAARANLKDSMTNKELQAEDATVDNSIIGTSRRIGVGATRRPKSVPLAPTISPAKPRKRRGLRDISDQDVDDAWK